MAIDETGLPSGAVTAPEDTAETPAPTRASDAQRLRVDSPLFHRDLGMSAASRLPQLRELTWEHVVRPSGQAPLDEAAARTPNERPDVLLGLLPVSPASTPTIDSLLSGGREHTAPSPSLAPSVTAAPTAIGSMPLAGSEAVDEPWPPIDPVEFSEPAAEPTLPASTPTEPASTPTLPATLPASTSPSLSQRPLLVSLASVLSDELPLSQSGSNRGAGEATNGIAPAPALDPLADQMLAIIAEQAGRDESGPIRRPDTMVNNLAALIANNTPAAGQERIEHEPSAVAEPVVVQSDGVADRPATDERVGPSSAHLRALEALDHDDERGERDSVATPLPVQVAPTSATPPVRISGQHGVLDSGQFERIRFDRTPSGAVPSIRQSGTVPAVGSAPSNVEAELNRLALLPDQEDEVGPVVVPTIAHNDSSPPRPAPSLSQHEMYQPRQVGPMVNARAAFVDVSSTFAPVRHKRKRGSALGRLVSFILLLGLLGGAVFAAKYYLLDPRWSGAVEQLASEVETARGLKFDHALTVEELPVEEYVLQLANRSLGVTAGNQDELAATWRALGVLNGSYTASTLGLTALSDAPAFYDPGSETIYVAKALPTELYTFGMHRALTLALLDQHFGWGGRLSKAAPSVQHGTLALYDADALATADSLTDAATRATLLTQIFTLHTTYDIPASPSPYLSTILGRLGVALVPYVRSLTPAARDLAETKAAITDGQALDLRRLVGKPPETAADTTVGMLFWYHALAGRLDNNQAWQAALSWQSDTVSSVKSLSAVCVVAEVVVSGAPTDAPAQAFQAWAAAAPAAAGTQITAAPNGVNTRLSIHVCDAGPGVPTNDGRAYLALGGAPLRAQQFLDLVIAQPTLPAAQLACAVYGGDAVSAGDERGVTDGAEVWPAPSTHPAVDPNRLGCAPAPAPA